MGDNKSPSWKEVKHLAHTKFPRRMKEMATELSWAIGLVKLPKKQTPPNWVRRLILIQLGDSPDPKKTKKTTGTEVSEFLGMLSGMAQAAPTLFRDADSIVPVPDSAKPLFKEFGQRMADVAKPHLALAETVLAKSSETIRSHRAAQAISFHKTQSKIVQEILSPQDDTLTDDLFWWLWFDRLEISTARSIAEIHSWLQVQRRISCSPKLVEKICRKIGLRPSKRGRKRK